MGSKLFLDDSTFLTRLDQKDMLDLTIGFPEQFSRALAIAESSDLGSKNTPRCVILAGMGGSAAGGDLVAALADELGARPFIVSRQYSLPHWADSSDLTIVASYSGNTEESLASYSDAKSKGVRVVAVTSGGQLGELAARDGFPVVRVPGGQPPRTAMGYMMVPALSVAQHIGVLPPQDYTAARLALEEALAAYGPTMPQATNPAKQLAEAMHGKLACLYGLGAWQGAVAGRWRAQINENAKNLAISHTFPELNHNEILGWIEAAGQNANGYVCVRLEDGTESHKMKTRASVTANLIADRCETLVATAHGGDRLAKILNLCLMGDFVSLYLAALNGVDPESIDWINALKSELSKVD